jgi:hypothetical protein
MMRLALATVLGAVALSSPTLAQQETWMSSLTPGEGAYFGSTHTLPHGPLWFICSGSRDGRPIDDGFADLPAPYTLTVELRHDALGRAAGPDMRGDLRIGVDDVIYQLPPLRFSPRKSWVSWSVHLSMSDAMLADIMDGGTVTAYAGDTVLSRHLGAIGRNLSDTIGFCIEEHLRTGLPVPAHAMAAVSAMRAGGQAAAAAPTAPETDRRMRDHVEGYCTVPAEIAPDNVYATELNGDGRPDTVLFWGGVDCLGGPNDTAFGAGNCGASQCLTSVFISGTGRGSLPDAELYTQGPVFDAGRPGQIGFALRLAACRETGLMPDCIMWQRWTGTGLQRVN